MREVLIASVCSTTSNIKWTEIGKEYVFKYIDLTSVSREELAITDPQDITKENAPSRAQRVVIKDDVIFATTRPTLRRLCIIPEQYNKQICSTGFCVLRPQKELITSRWLFLALQTDKFYNYIEKRQKGASYPAVTDSDVKEFSIPLPSLAEQQRIVDILDAEFAKIDVLKANAEKNLQNAQDLFQAALKKELEPKESWVKMKLGDCFVSIRNGANIKQIKGAGGIPITRIETLSNDKFNRNRLGYANISSSASYADYVLNEGDILMSHINSMKFLGRAVVYKKQDNETIIHGMNLLRLVPEKELCSDYMAYQFITDDFRSQIQSISHQSVNQASFNTTALKGLIVGIPPFSEQRRIASRLDFLSRNVKELQENQQKIIALCDDLKQALLRKAFNGEL